MKIIKTPVTMWFALLALVQARTPMTRREKKVRAKPQRYRGLRPKYRRTWRTRQRLDVVRILIFQARSLTYPSENSPDDEHRVERQTEIERPIHTKTSRFEAAIN
jgi:hypothetical protein